MANTVSRRSVVYDILFEVEQGKKSAKEAEKSLKDVGKSANDTEDAVKSLGQQFLQFSGVQQQLNQLKTAMTAVGLATGGVTTGMKLLKVALVSTGIGAIVVALGSLFTYLTQTARGMDLMNKATTAVGVAISAVVDRISRFGEGLALIISGKWSEGVDKLRNSFKGLGDEIAREVKQSLELSDALDKVEDREIDLIKIQAERRKRVSELRLQAKDETKSIGERRKALQEAIKVEKSILQDELEIAKERARISQERTDAGESTKEELKENAELQARVIDLQTAYNDRVRGFTRELNGLNEETKELNLSYDDMVKKLKQLREAQSFINTSTAEGKSQFEQLDDQAKKLTETLDGLLQLKGQTLEVSTKEIEIARQLDLTYKEAQKTKAEDGFIASKLIEQDKQRAEAQKALQDALLSTGDATVKLLEVMGVSSDAQMAISIATALASQAEAIAKGIASASSLPFPANLAAIATTVGTIISTFAQVFTITSQAKAAKARANAFAEGEVDIHRPGEVRGKDSIPAVIMPGESVITTDKTKRYKPFLQAIHEGNLEDLIRVSYVEPALALTAMEQAQKDSTIDYSQRFYKQLLATSDGNSINKRSVRILERIEKKIGNQKPSWYV